MYKPAQNIHQKKNQLICITENSLTIAKIKCVKAAGRKKTVYIGLKTDFGNSGRQ